MNDISPTVDEKQGKQKAAFAYSERYRLMLFFSVNSYRCHSAALLCCCLILVFFFPTERQSSKQARAQAINRGTQH